MKPEDVERLLGNLEPAPPPARLERNVLADGERLLGRPARRTRPWGIAGVAAACLLLSAVLYRILVPQPGDRCRSTIEFETHLDQKAAAGPPAFPTHAIIWESVGPLLRRADAVKPLAEELRWLNIPWVLSFEEAERMARAEKRPIFIWVASDDPLGRCCGCAAGLRVGPLSQEEVVRRVSENFVPVALDRKVLLKGKGGELLRSLQRQKDQYHGIWIVSPDGKVLAGYPGPKSNDRKEWTLELVGTLEAALRSFGPVAPRKVEPVDLRPHRGTGVRPDGSVSLAVHCRLMHKGSRDGPVALDTLTLEEKEWALLVPSRMAVGEKFALPEGMARKFCRIASPVSDPDFMPLPEHAKAAELQGEVVSLEGGAAAIRLAGKWVTERLTSDKVSIRASATAEGLIIVDVQSRTMRSFLLVTTGEFFDAPTAKPRETGAVLEWNAR